MSIEVAAQEVAHFDTRNSGTHATGSSWVDERWAEVHYSGDKCQGG